MENESQALEFQSHHSENNLRNSSHALSISFQQAYISIILSFTVENKNKNVKEVKAIHKVLTVLQK